MAMVALRQAAIGQKRTCRTEIGGKYAEMACFSSHPAPRSIFEPLASTLEFGLGRSLRQTANINEEIFKVR